MEMDVFLVIMIACIILGGALHVFNSNQDYKTKMNLIRRVQRIEKELGITND